MNVISPQHPARRDEAEELQFRADRALLSARLFRPATATPHAAIVLHGATGVPQGYYRDFAAWLAAQGYACLTYDYRDFGASAQGHMRTSNATMADWGVADQTAAQAQMAALFPQSPLWVIGHSLGGMMVPFQASVNRIDRLITVASGPVHLSDHPWPYRAVAALFWHGPPALATALLGYLPARAFRFGPDLPAGVYWQWRRWCTTRGFYTCDAGRSLPMPEFRAYDGPMKLVAVADDQMVPPAAVWRLMQSYPEARKRQLVLHPGDHGLPRIGHIGAFHRKNAVLWPEIMR